MRIQTQARLLVAGIVIAPLLVIIILVSYQQFFRISNEGDLNEHEEISALLHDHIDAEDLESLTRIVVRYNRNRSQFAVFRDDYFVFYSTIPEFDQGGFADREDVLSLLDSEDERPVYSFVSRNLNEMRVFILNRTTPQTAPQALPRPPVLRTRMLPFFVPVTFIFIFIILLILFAICMSIAITRTITRSVQVLENTTRRIAEGELDLQVDIKGSNEITSLTKSLNKMRNALKEEELRRSRFIMGITHDLKTPLALIKGYAEAIEDGVTEDPVSRTDAAQVISAKADQLEGMINDLIGFVRMETGEWREQLKEIDSAAFFRDMAKTWSTDILLLHHEFSHDIDLPEELFICMDEKLVQRAFENLISNAIRHTPNGSCVRLTAALTENAVELVISDNGPGIDKDALPSVFEMFYRGSSSRREQGMGLGLAVVKWVVDYHGWTISASSDKGASGGNFKGTKFTIIIPISSNKAPKLV